MFSQPGAIADLEVGRDGIGFVCGETDQMDARIVKEQVFDVAEPLPGEHDGYLGPALATGRADVRKHWASSP